MSKTLTPEQRAALRADCDRAVAGALTLPVRHVAALLDAADERDRLAADLDALRQRAEQGAALPPPAPAPAPTAVSDPDLYAQMSRPRRAAVVDAANHAFWEDVSAARARHGIRDVVIVSTAVTFGEDGEPVARMNVGNRGDGSIVTKLLATALGVLRREMDQELDDLAAGRDEEG